QVNGRKRHLVVDTQGFVLKGVVWAAEVQDREGHGCWRTRCSSTVPTSRASALSGRTPATAGSSPTSCANRWAGRGRWSSARTSSRAAPLRSSRTGGLSNGRLFGGRTAPAEQRLWLPS